MKIPLDLGTIEVRRNEKNTAIIFEACQGEKKLIVTMAPKRANEVRLALLIELAAMDNAVEMLAKGLT